MFAIFFLILKMLYITAWHWLNECVFDSNLWSRASHYVQATLINTVDNCSLSFPPFSLLLFQPHFLQYSDYLSFRVGHKKRVRKPYLGEWWRGQQKETSLNMIWDSTILCFIENKPPNLIRLTRWVQVTPEKLIFLQ